eukprot:362322-Chlamydomonas_euryale.AAC.6
MHAWACSQVPVLQASSGAMQASICAHIFERSCCSPAPKVSGLRDVHKSVNRPATVTRIVAPHIPLEP